MLDRDGIRTTWYSSLNPTLDRNKRLELWSLLRKEFDELATCHTGWIPPGWPGPYNFHINKINQSLHALGKLPDKSIVMPILAGGFYVGALTVGSLRYIGKKVDVVLSGLSRHPKVGTAEIERDKVYIAEQDLTFLKERTSRSILLVDDIIEYKVTLMHFDRHLRELGFKEIFYTTFLELEYAGLSKLADTSISGRSAGGS